MKPHTRKPVIDFHETKDYVDQYNEREAQRAVYPCGDFLECSEHPTDVEVLGPEALNYDPMPFEPFGHLVVKQLEPGGIGDDVASDPAEPPGDHPGEGADDQDGREHADRKRHELRQPRLQTRLQGPDDRYDEQRERQRREDGRGDPQCGDHENYRSNTNHRTESAVACSACSLDWIAHCAGAFGGCHSV
jgi:hypothetical protein